MFSTLPSLLIVVLCAAPVVAIALQWAVAAQEGTVSAYSRHYTAAYVDLIFVILNYYMLKSVDWNRADLAILALILSAVLNAVAHMLWQQNPGAGGHMINANGKFLQGGWVHLAFSTVQMALIIFWFFGRTGEQPYDGTATVLLMVFFIAGGIAGYFISGRRVILTDVVMVLGGSALAVWPYVVKAVR